MKLLRFVPLLSALLVVLSGGGSLLRAADGVPITPVPKVANVRVAVVQVRVTPDRRDWTYAVGERARFHVAVVADNIPLDRAVIRYEVGPELLPTPTREVEVGPEGLWIEAEPMRAPGFVRCSVRSVVNGLEYRGAATAAFAPEQIQATQTEPADFDAFWAKSLAELAAVPLEPRLTLLPEACTDRVNVYHVSFRNVGGAWTGNARVYGILCEPKEPGRYPAVLRVPGAGVRPYSGDLDLASRGFITLEIGVHGIPVNQPKEVYDQLLAGALNNYWFFNLDDRERYYYRRVYLGCVRANDFLVTRPGWDGKNLIVTGASQGGQLSIVTAALDPRVTALAAVHPAMCDVSGPLHGRAGGWPHAFRPAPDGTPSPHATPAKIETLRYYDTVNFARRLKVPGFYIWGYNDETCPPTSTFAMFNVVRAPRTLAVQLEQAHTYPVEQWNATRDWILQQVR
jgi:cephalosporin-C deacetylase-like acetyl esterase